MGTKWGAQQYSPDWTDVMVAMKAVEELHQVTLIVSTTTGVFGGPSGYTTLSAHARSKTGEASILGSPVIALSGEWPCKDHKDFYACLLSAVYSIDSALSSKVWEQKKLPFTAETPGA